MYSRQIVAAVTQIPLRRLKVAIQENLLRIDGDGVAGHWTRCSAADVVRFGVWGRLVAFGFSTTAAAELVNDNRHLVDKAVSDAMSGVYATWVLARMDGGHFEYEGFSGPTAAQMVETRRRAFRPLHLELDLAVMAREILRDLSQAERYLRSGEVEEDDDQDIETRARATWDADPKLRAEFLDSFEVYLCYRRAIERGAVKFDFGK